MRILLIGSGGREHALAWAIAASPLCTKLYCAPGNAGIAEQAECVDIKATDLAGLVKFAREKSIDFAVVGPEDPLVLGLADALRQAGIKTFGPSKLAARLEGSKKFTKDMCAKYKIPTGFYQSFTAVEPALAYIRAQGAPIVVKADGLAAGKGVTVAMNVAEAEAAVRACLNEKIFGAAGASVLIEEFLDGEEASFFALCDGKTALPLIGAQDHKRVGDGDSGPNTGGMGSYSPAPIFDAAMQDRVMAEIVRPTLAGMEQEGCPFQGVLFVGLMIGADGPKLIEFNVRFGDPECQTLMLRLKSDLLTALLSSAEGALAKFDLRWREQTAITVVMAAPGYPIAPVKGSEIRNLDKAALVPGVTIFHAGTKRDGSKLIAYGGRVLNISAIGADVVEARELAYRAIALIDWPEGIYRRDIGWRAVHRLHSK